jgi:hypothetical protein
MVAKIIIGVVTSAMVCAVVWFGVKDAAPMLWRHIMDGEAALRERPQLLATIEADRLAANGASKSCDARVTSSLRSAGTINRLAAPRTSTTPGAQPALDAEAIRSIVQ